MGKKFKKSKRKNGSRIINDSFGKIIHWDVKKYFNIEDFLTDEIVHLNIGDIKNPPSCDLLGNLNLYNMWVVYERMRENKSSDYANKARVIGIDGQEPIIIPGQHIGNFLENGIIHYKRKELLWKEDYSMKANSKVMFRFMVTEFGPEAVEVRPYQRSFH